MNAEELLRRYAAGERNFAGVDLREAELTRISLVGANLRGVNLTGANLNCSALRKADLRNANLKGTDLSGANLIQANLQGVDLRRALMWGTGLREANLSDANLQGANLTNAWLNNAEFGITGNMESTILIGTNFEGARISYVLCENWRFKSIYNAFTGTLLCQMEVLWLVPDMVDTSGVNWVWDNKLRKPKNKNNGSKFS